MLYSTRAVSACPTYIRNKKHLEKANQKKNCFKSTNEISTLNASPGN